MLVKVISVEKEVQDILDSIPTEFPGYTMDKIRDLFHDIHLPHDTESEVSDMVKCCCQLTSMEHPRYSEIAARFELLQFNKRIKRAIEQIETDGVFICDSLYAKITYLTECGLYSRKVTEAFSKKMMDECESYINPEYDKLLDYAAVDLLTKRYIIKSHDHEPLETIQEMFLGIAMFLAANEPKEDRLKYVKEFYHALASLRVTVATPTLGNARKPYHQLSSCFIDTVPDSLDGIYRSIDNFARVSKLGGGMGLYLGKIRGSGGSIRGFTGAAGGVIPWVKIINDTAVAVDQLGVRQGAVAVYLDIWHYDLLEFTQLRTNNGDDRKKAHDIFPALCVPDLFWKLARENIDGQWTLLCPQSVEKVLHYRLEDYYGDEWEYRYAEAAQHPDIRKKSVSVKDVIKLIIKSLVETGTPFIFNRDTVNRTNPNKHKGMIYSSNLCTEIAQNMSPIATKSYHMEDGEVVYRTIPGDFVVCNLASLVLPRILNKGSDEANMESLNSTVRTAVRMLDNVIDQNLYPVPYAYKTNKEYRALGLGVSGYHHWLALNKISWESKGHLDFVDKWFEKINYYAIKASADLAKERGTYAHFAGSDWCTGAYFDQHGYTSPEWHELKMDVQLHGMRNGYLLAIAPTSSTSIVANTTAGIDPIMKKYFLEEKKSGLLPRVAPNLNAETTWFYKNAHHIDQNWSIEACGVRQRHIDQAQSMNIYITNDTTMRTVMDYYIRAWECGVKTIYYVRSTSLEVNECESCAS